MYNTDGAKIFQTFQDNQALTGQARTFTTARSVPASQATGADTIKISVFKPGWSGLYAWNNNAATLGVK